MKKPILLTKYDLVVPIKQALDRLEKIRQRKAVNDDKIILEGLFVLAVASFENSLNDTLKVLLTHIPEKLDSKLDNISKEDLIEGDPLQKAIQNKVNSISYKNLREIIDYFIKTTSINDNSISDVQFEKLQEIKATRNLLLHNNLKINNIYNETSGPLRRSGRENRLEIDQNYLYLSIVTLKDILQAFSSELVEKYNNYTRVNAVKNLWTFMFNTPVLVFENEWEIDYENDFVKSYRHEQSNRSSLSGGEEFLFSIWLSHFNGDRLRTDFRNFYHLDNWNREKLGFFMSVVDILKKRGISRERHLPSNSNQ